MVRIIVPLLHESLLIFLDSNEPDWIVAQTKARKRREMLRSREELEERLAKIRAKEKAQKVKYIKGDLNFKKRKTNAEADEKDDDEEQFVLEDYDSDTEHNGSKKGGDATYSAATLELMSKLGMGPNTLKAEEEEAEDEIKVRHAIRNSKLILTFEDILLLSNPFSINAVHQRATSHQVASSYRK